MKQNRVQSSLEEALTNEREKGCGLEFKLTNEIARSKELENEVEKLQKLLQTARTEVTSSHFTLSRLTYCVHVCSV